MNSCSMPNQPEASVIVPAFNVGQYIQRCIDSIVRTERNSIELIVVDDGSTDETGKVADELSRHNQMIRVVHTENQGVSAARNLALEQSRGRYVFFVDADDYVEDGYIDSSIDKFEASGCDVLLQRAKFEDSKGSVTQQSISEEAVKKIVSGANPVYAGYPLYLWNYAFTKDAIGSIRFDTHLKISEDADFISKVCSSVDCYAFSDGPWYRYSVGRPESALTEIDLRGCIDIKRVKAKIIQRANNNDDISRIVDEYGAASFGVLRRCACNSDVYYKEVCQRKEMLLALKKSRSLKAKICVQASHHKRLLRLFFIAASVFNKKIKVK